MAELIHLEKLELDLEMAWLDLEAELDGYLVDVDGYSIPHNFVSLIEEGVLTVRQVNAIAYIVGSAGHYRRVMESLDCHRIGLIAEEEVDPRASDVSLALLEINKEKKVA